LWKGCGIGLLGCGVDEYAGWGVERRNLGLLVLGGRVWRAMGDERMGMGEDARVSSGFSFVVSFSLLPFSGDMGEGDIRRRLGSRVSIS